MKNVSRQSLVGDILAKYDHNKSGAIDLTRPDGVVNKLKNPDERVRSSSQVTPSLDPNKTIDVHSQVYTQRDLFYRADENRDNKVTREELDQVVKGFDKDGDGNLGSRGFWGWLTRKPKQELDQFNDQYGEQMTNSSKTGI